MTARYLVNNLITSEAMITASSERAGQVGLAVKIGTGAATMLASGLYTGASPIQYIIQIDSVAGGSGIGQATFKWRPSTNIAWTATGVATALAPTVLENGVAVAWSSGGGTEFTLGDYWAITVDKAFGRLRLIDRDRDTEWRSSSVGSPVTIDCNLGTAQAVDVVAICDHNLTATATITILADDEATFTAPPLSEMITWQANNVIRYLTTGTRTYRYWRLSVTDTSNTDGYLRIGSLYLGTYVEFSRTFAYEWARTREAATYGPAGALRKPRGVWAQAELIDILYGFMTAADRTKALALFDHLYDSTTGIVRPIIVNFDTTDTADVSLYELDDPEFTVTTPRKTDTYGWRLRLRQRPRLARSGT